MCSIYKKKKKGLLYKDMYHPYLSPAEIMPLVLSETCK